MLDKPSEWRLRQAIQWLMKLKNTLKACLVIQVVPIVNINFVVKFRISKLFLPGLCDGNSQPYKTQIDTISHLIMKSNFPVKS